MLSWRRGCYSFGCKISFPLSYSIAVTEWSSQSIDSILKSCLCLMWNVSAKLSASSRLLGSFSSFSPPCQVLHPRLPDTAQPPERHVLFLVYESWQKNFSKLEKLQLYFFQDFLLLLRILFLLSCVCVYGLKYRRIHKCMNIGFLKINYIKLRNIKRPFTNPFRSHLILLPSFKMRIRLFYSRLTPWKNDNMPTAPRFSFY